MTLTKSYRSLQRDYLMFTYEFFQSTLFPRFATLKDLCSIY